MSGPALLRAADRRAVPWKDGGGITREIAVHPPGAGMDDFEWRVSIADVDATGPFSRFENVDRILTLLEGRLQLDFAEATPKILLGPGDRHCFAGDAAVTGTPMGGPLRDLNIMVRRGLWSAKIEPYRPGAADGDVRIALATKACGTIEALDALLLRDGEDAPPGFTGYLIMLDRLSG